MKHYEEWQVAAREQCGCHIVEDSGPYIVYCPKHAAAPDLFGLCMSFVQAWDSVAIALWTNEDVQPFRAALALAEEE